MRLARQETRPGKRLESRPPLELLALCSPVHVSPRRPKRSELVDAWGLPASFDILGYCHAFRPKTGNLEVVPFIRIRTWRPCGPEVLEQLAHARVSTKEAFQAAMISQFGTLFRAWREAKTGIE